MIVVDREGTVVSVNDAGKRILPLESDVPVRPWELFELRDLETSGQLERDSRPLMRALRGERAPDADYLGVVVATGAEVPLRISAAPLFDEEGAVRGAIAVFTKIPRP